MRKTIEVALATIILALCLSKAAGMPIEGTWEGTIAGKKAMTVKIAEVAGNLEGHAILYVVDNKFGDPDARLVGQSQSDLGDLKWDGKTLRFIAADAQFEMTVSGANAAVLKRQNSEMTVSMKRVP
jgi:hypothetical protein